MAQQEGEWITVNGRHILIGAGESREEAINRAIANKNADKKNEQIAKNQEQADKLNGKQSMTMDKDYYDKHVDMAVEFEDEDGYKYWEQCKGNEVDSLIKQHTADGRTYFSDMDLNSKQSDPKVKEFLNFVFYNTDHNPNFKDKGMWSVLEKAFGVEFTIPNNTDKKYVHFK